MSANKETIAQWIREKKTALGIEFGSTRIKAVLVGEDHTPIASFPVLSHHCIYRKSWRRHLRLPGNEHEQKIHYL